MEQKLRGQNITPKDQEKQLNGLDNEQKLKPKNDFGSEDK